MKSIFIGGTSSPQRREGRSFYTIPQKLAVGNYAVETGISSFGIRTSGF
jgi:hypothetical protein